LQNSTDVDVLQDNKLCIVEDIKLNALKTSIENTLK